MECVLTFIIGVLFIVLSIVWYNYEKKKFLKQRKKSDYTKMSFYVEFIFGSLILFLVGVKMIYDSFFN